MWLCGLSAAAPAHRRSQQPGSKPAFQAKRHAGRECLGQASQGFAPQVGQVVGLLWRGSEFGFDGAQSLKRVRACQFDHVGICPSSQLTGATRAPAFGLHTQTVASTCRRRHASTYVASKQCIWCICQMAPLLQSQLRKFSAMPNCFTSGRGSYVSLHFSLVWTRL